MIVTKWTRGALKVGRGGAEVWISHIPLQYSASIHLLEGTHGRQEEDVMGGGRSDLKVQKRGRTGANKEAHKGKDLRCRN